MRAATIVGAVPGHTSGTVSSARRPTRLPLPAGKRRSIVLTEAPVEHVIDCSLQPVPPGWSGPGTLTDARMSQKGEAVFAMLYLPVPVIDVYLKAGIARLTTRLSIRTNFVSCVSPLQSIGMAPVSGSLDTTETAFAAGAGAQWKLGDWAVRAEYERFSSLGQHPDLVTLGVTRSFL